MSRVNAAIIGPGNIGTDLMIKMVERATNLDLRVMVGIDPESAGLARAATMGIATVDNGLSGLLDHPERPGLGIVFDATSAKAHRAHHDAFAGSGTQIVDLTPAAIGPYVVPVVNLGEHIGAENVNLVTCGGQATIPMVAAVSKVGRVHYGEIVASISSRSAGPGTRANIDEFTQTTARGIEVIGGADVGKAIIVLNPADPPLLMRNTVFVFTESDDHEAITASIKATVAEVSEYVPGYRLVQEPVFESFMDTPLRTPDRGELHGTKVSVFLEVEGAGDHLPTYAGNLDIMTSAALQVGELIAEHRLGGAS